MKPELWQDEAIGEISRDARLLFVGLITQADDEGRLRGDPRLLAAQIYPYDDFPRSELEAWLDELEGADLIQLYTANSRPLICLPAWKSNQKISHASKSKLPKPPARRRRSREDSGTAPEDSGGSPKRSTTIKDQGEDQGRERIGNNSSSAADAADTGEGKAKSPAGGRLSNLLADLIARNDPDGKRPNVGKGWLDAERLLLTRDGRNSEQVEAVVRWVQADDFESAVVLSMPKFRERYPQLLQKAQRAGAISRSGRSARNVDAFLRPDRTKVA